MEKEIELIVKRMRPGDPSAKLYSFLVAWGYRIAVRKDPSKKDTVRRIFWLDRNEPIVTISGNDLLIFNCAGQNGVYGRAQTWTADQLLSGNGMFTILEALAGTYRNKPEPRICMSFDVETKDEKHLCPLNEFLAHLARKRVKCSVFLTGECIHAVESLQMVDALQAHEIGNHTSDHRKACRANIKEGHQLISKLFPSPGIFRAPFLESGFGAIETLRELGYRGDSSYYGITVHPIFEEHEEPYLMSEIPLLDGGDYALLYARSMEESRYLDTLREKLIRLRGLQTSFSILFHPQYSSPHVWEKVVDMATAAGYNILSAGELAGFDKGPVTP